MAYIDLDGEWLVRGYPVGTVSSDQVLEESVADGGWLPAQVPGDVHLDLQRAGVIDDPYYRENAEQAHWVDRQDWWFRRTFTVDQQLLDEDRVELVCEGLDTFALLLLNGQPVGNTDNMLREWRFDARPFLRGGYNELVIGFHATKAACCELAHQFGRHRGNYNFPDIVQARKAQYSAGWDFTPPMTTLGIWQPVRIESWSTARITSVYVRPLNITEQRAKIAVTIELEGITTCPVTLDIGIAPFVGEIGCAVSRQFTLEAGANSLTQELEILEPRLWWPAGYGEQQRYRAEIQIAGEGVSLYATAIFGLRTVNLVREPDADGESFLFEINGTRIFSKGANWVPGDFFPSRVSEEYYRKNLGLAVQGKMNMLRVWGGGLYESETFYNICDEMGLLVWQDFPFACGSYPEYASLQANVTAEASQAIRRLRNHPSLVLWCGNDECDWLLPKAEGNSGYMYYDQLLPHLCAELDPSRPYWPGSPYSRGDRPANSSASGDRHCWEIGAGMLPDMAYYFERGHFISEFGMQAPPTMPTLESFTAPEDRKPWSAVMQAHEKDWEHYARVVRYMEPHVPISSNFRWWVYGAQTTQCLLLQRAITHWRARKWLTAGTLVWQMNDLWPGITWSLVDHYGHPKPGWYAVRNAYQPVLLTIQPVIPPDITDAFQVMSNNAWMWMDRDIVLVNDTLQPLEGRVRVRLMDFLGGVSWEKEVPAVVSPNSMASALVVKIREMGTFHPRRQVLVAELLNEEGVLSREIHWFAEPKLLELPDQQLGVEQYERRFTVSARDMALFVEVDAEEGFPSDNFFNLLPGESHTVYVDGPLHHVSVRSLADLLREA